MTIISSSSVRGGVNGTTFGKPLYLTPFPQHPWQFASGYILPHLQSHNLLEMDNITRKPTTKICKCICTFLPRSRRPLVNFCGYRTGKRGRGSGGGQSEGSWRRLPICTCLNHAMAAPLSARLPAVINYTHIHGHRQDQGFCCFHIFPMRKYDLARRRFPQLEGGAPFFIVHPTPLNPALVTVNLRKLRVAWNIIHAMTPSIIFSHKINHHYCVVQERGAAEERGRSGRGCCPCAPFYVIRSHGSMNPYYRFDPRTVKSA